MPNPVLEDPLIGRSSDVSVIHGAAEGDKQTLGAQKTHGGESHSTKIGNDRKLHVLISDCFGVAVGKKGGDDFEAGLLADVLEVPIVVVLGDLPHLAGLVVDVDDVG